jgi:hypothetical protein
MLSEETRDRLDGLVNPLLVRGMYQSLHSRGFVAALWLLLGCSLVAYAVVFAVADGKPCGGAMAGVFVFLMYVAGAVVLPYLAFSNLNGEVKTGTLELIHITRLNARKQVRGRMLASAVKIGLLFSVMGPFAVAAFLFKGEGAAVELILTLLYVVLLYSLLVCAIGIFFAALTSVPALRVLARLVFCLFLLLSFLWSFNLVGGLGAIWMMGGTGGVTPTAGLLFGLAIHTVTTLLLVWFLCAASANLLTFEADKCSSRTKGIALVIVGVWWISFVAGTLWAGGSATGPAFAFAIISSLFVSVCCAFWLTGRPRVAARHVKRFRRFGTAYKRAMFPLVDGPGSTASYMGLAFLGIVTGTVLLSAAGGPNPPDTQAIFYPLLLFPIYVLFYCTLARGVARLAPERFRTPTLVRGAFLGLVVLNFVIFVIWAIVAQGDIDDVSANPLSGLFPFIYLCSLIDSHEPWGMFADLAIPALVGITYHLFAFARQYGRYHVHGQYN